MKRGVIIALGIVLLLLAIGGGYWWLSYQASKTLTLASSQPTDQQKDASPATPLTFTFTQELKQTQNSSAIKVSPLFSFETKISGKEIRITPRVALQENTQYLITLSNVESVSGQKLTATISFTTGINESTRARFLRTLPHTTDQYSVQYNEDRNSFLVLIQSLPQEQSKQAALNYFRTQGINSLEENIEFQVLRTLQGQGAPPG